MIELTSGEHRRLKAHAHKLHPVVIVGGKGLTEAVLHAIDASLKSHELIKVKVASDDRAVRETVLADICAAVGASPVQHIGKILVLYRENPVLPVAPAPQPAPARAKPARAKPARAKPARAKPARAKPARAKPARAKPAPARAARAKPPRRSAAAKAPERQGAELARAVKQAGLARPRKRPPARSGAPRRTQ
jgi:RNA-binding protein